MKKYFITGIGTEVGKTVASAVLVEKMKADYWKPIQSGDLDMSDSMKVKKLISNPITKIHPEKYRLHSAVSPHLSAKIDNIKILLSDFKLPETSNHLIVEGAGGLFVPINQENTIIDLIQILELETILVSRNYLGSINHTILSVEALKNKGISIRGILFSGSRNESSEQFIENYCKVPILGYLPEMKIINAENVSEATKYIHL